MLSKNDAERERYQARLKWERDQTAIDEAREEGLKEGLMEGSRKGEWIGRIHAFQQLLQIPATPKGELSILRVEELQHMAQALEERLGIAQKRSNVGE